MRNRNNSIINGAKHQHRRADSAQLVSPVKTQQHVDARQSGWQVALGGGVKVNRCIASQPGLVPFSRLAQQFGHGAVSGKAGAFQHHAPDIE